MMVALGFEMVGASEAEMVVAELVELACVRNTKEGEQEEGGKRRLVAEE